jgi:integrase
VLTIRRRKGSPFWHARGTVPTRQADGSITRVRIEESTRETSKSTATRVAADLAQHYYEQAYRPKPKPISFLEAAITYVETKQPSKRDRGFVAKLVAYFGETQIGEIDQAAVATAAHRLYPGRSASTHNRAVYAPIVTVLRLSKERPDFRRPRVHRKPPNIPPEEWFDSVLPHCPVRLAALLVFLTLTGRRITEACNAELGADGTAIIHRTKSGSPVVVDVPSVCLDLLARAGPSSSKRLFGYSDRHNVYRALRPVCKRAGVPYYGSHAFGRHGFASRLLREGKSLKFVADAGGWKTARLVIDTYGHLEQREVRREVKELGEEWGRRLEKRQKKAEPEP